MEFSTVIKSVIWISRAFIGIIAVFNDIYRRFDEVNTVFFSSSLVFYRIWTVFFTHEFLSRALKKKRNRRTRYWVARERENDATTENRTSEKSLWDVPLTLTVRSIDFSPQRRPQDNLCSKEKHAVIIIKKEKKQFKKRVKEKGFVGGRFFLNQLPALPPDCRLVYSPSHFSFLSSSHQRWEFLFSFSSSPSSSFVFFLLGLLVRVPGALHATQLHLSRRPPVAIFVRPTTTPATILNSRNNTIWEEDGRPGLSFFSSLSEKITRRRSRRRRRRRKMKRSFCSPFFFLFFHLRNPFGRVPLRTSIRQRTKRHRSKPEIPCKPGEFSALP